MNTSVPVFSFFLLSWYRRQRVATRLCATRRQAILHERPEGFIPSVRLNLVVASPCLLICFMRLCYRICDQKIPTSVLPGALSLNHLQCQDENPAKQPMARSVCTPLALTYIFLNWKCLRKRFQYVRLRSSWKQLWPSLLISAMLPAHGYFQFRYTAPKAVFHQTRASNVLTHSMEA